MRLQFAIAPYDGMLEARHEKWYYVIYDNDGSGVNMHATVNGERLAVGDIYTCLDACNAHVKL